jgi:hypothetical protein
MKIFIVLASPYSAALPLPNDLNLAHNTHLRHISLMIDHDELVEWAFTLLSQITSLSVEHILLNIIASTLVSFDAAYCARMDRLLTQQRWANLRRLSVRSWPRHCHCVPPGAMELIRSRLPILESRGVILDLAV